MFELSVTPELLIVLLAGLAAILFDWFPRLSTWYDKLSVLKKKQLMAVLLAVIVSVIYSLGCLGVLALACTKAQVVELVSMYLVAIGINQGVHWLGKPTGSG